jgi:hypothetical protein
MSEHPLHRFDVRAGRDREAGRRVPQLVRRQAVEAECRCRVVEPPPIDTFGAPRPRLGAVERLSESRLTLVA